MNIYTNNTGMRSGLKCEACITTKRNRVKVYEKDDSAIYSPVYLKDGQKFEIELFNPHGFKVLAKISFNGRRISDAGIVVNPGQRIYLERYLDTNNAFVFSTYEIDGSDAAMQAISENGNIEVDFYSQQDVITPNPFGNPTWTFNPIYEPQYGTTTIGHNQFYCSTDVFGCNTSIASYHFLDNINETVKGSKETGIVEKGGKVDQKFTESYDTFNTWPLDTVRIKMLPASAKPIESKEIRNYCTECGTRMKKATWKFCPNCGTKA